MATIRLPTDFAESLRLLGSSGVESLLVVGDAVGLYGTWRIRRAAGHENTSLTGTAAPILRRRLRKARGGEGSREEPGQGPLPNDR